VNKITPQPRKALFCGILAVMAWSTVATAFKLALRHLDHYQLLFLANVFSLASLGLVLAVGGRWRQLGAMSPLQWKRAAALGFLNPFVYYLVLFKAYDLLPAQIAQPLNYTWALTLSLLAVPLLGQRLTWRDIVAGLVCYLGVVVISTGGQLHHLHVASPLGVGLALGSTIIWALYWLGNTRFSQGREALDPVVGLFVGFAIALPLVTAVTLVFSDLHFTPPGVAAGAYVGAVEMGFTFVLWLTAMRLTDSTARIANLIFLSPFLSLVLIHHVLGERVVPGTVAGLVLIVGGLVLQAAGKRRRPSSIP
jgi:drug/metabolite transporter (DMT)-like permease